MRIGRVRGKSGKWHVIERAGKKKSQGGEGTQWTCSCQDGKDEEERHVCWHLLALWQRALKPECLKLTKAGKKLLKVA